MRSFALAALALLASVQQACAAQIDVTVGGTGILKFTPSFVNATTGDVIVFTFKQKNHTVTQSSLANPCSPLAKGFDSQFMPVAATDTVFPTAKLTINNTNPIWAYCRQSTHCQGGMVFAVNPGSQFPNFLAAATGGVTPSTTTSSTPPASTSVASSADHKVIVGGTGVLAFNPPNITANVGDTITFEFHQKNHTVTASSFDSPCRNLFSTTGSAGFDSGYNPVSDGATSFPTYVVQVNDSKPIWAYCMQANHCAQGMVFAANAVESSSKNFAAFLANAKQSNGTSTGTTTPYGSGASAMWRPTVGSTSMAVLLVISVALVL